MYNKLTIMAVPSFLVCSVARVNTFYYSSRDNIVAKLTAMLKRCKVAAVVEQEGVVNGTR